MALTSTGADEADPGAFTRSPVDRLFLGCVLAACAGYVAFLIAMQFMPREAEGPAKQSYLGVVEGQSQPAGGGPGEDDPAEGVAVRGGSGSAYYAGGGRPRPVVLIDGGSRGPSSAVAPGEVPTGQALGPVQIGRTLDGPVGELGRLSQLTMHGLGAVVRVGVDAIGELETDAPEAPVPVAPDLRGQGCSSP